ncbi:MAG: CBS domain-containing protein [Solirubrobacteraceae bacterium]
MAQQVLHLSSVLRGPLLDRAGERLGRVEDLIVRLADGGYPPVTGLKARIGGRELFVPIDKVASLDDDGARLAGEKLSLGRFERREGEVLLAQDVLGHNLVNVETAILITAYEIALTRVEGWWRVVGVDPSFRAELRYRLPRPLGSRLSPGPILDWSELEPFVGHVPTARLRFSHRRLAKLHPAQIADLVEEASHEEGQELIEAVRHDRELEADVFEELDEHHQLEFIRERPDDQVAQVLSRMATDEATDLLGELEQDRRGKVLSLLPAKQQRQIRALLGYNPSTAGGLMSTEFVSMSARETAAAALERVRTADIEPEALHAICVSDERGQLVGMVPVAALIRAGANTPLQELAAAESVSVGTDADLPEVARLMTDFNLVALAVLDGECKPVGVVTVDDVLELVLPAGWRRRFGVSREQQQQRVTSP